MTDAIKTATGRASLPIAADEIHYVKHSTGQYIGFRKTAPKLGTWWARYRDPETGRQYYKNLGEFAEHDNSRRYDAALAAALEWFRQADAGVVPHSLTVKDVCEQHIKALRIHDGDRKAQDEEARFTRYVYNDPVARIELGKLRADHLNQWKGRLRDKPARVSRSPKKDETRTRSAATINRDMVPLRAALNRALDQGLVSNDLAWRVALRPIENADRRREIYLDRTDRAALIKAAADEIKPLLRALSLLPLRPGALAALKVADFNARLHSLRIGKDKTGNDRRITVPGTTSVFLKELAKDKLPAAALIGRPDGSHWNKDSWKWPIKEAVLAAGLPAEATAYSLRHSIITDLVTGGLNLLTVAQISGTSVAMIERFYGHYQRKQAADALAKLAL